MIPARRSRGSLLFWAWFVLATTVACADVTERPFIWVTAPHRPAIERKLETQAWAEARFDAMAHRAAAAVSAHRGDCDAFLRALPLINAPTGSTSHPTLRVVDGNMAGTDRATARSAIQTSLQVGIDCGVMYYLTGDERYARVTADILRVVVEALVLMPVSEDTNNGGWLYPNDHLYESRSIGAQIPLLYDFVAPYLRSGGTAYDLVTRKQVSFAFDHAQQVFRTYARLAIEHGIINTNWPVLEMNSLVHNVLAIDDPAERGELLFYVTERDTAHQDSLRKVLAEYDGVGAVWPESLQYSSGVSQRLTYVVALLQRQRPQLELPDNYANVPLSLARLQMFAFPNGQHLRFGDGTRRMGSDGRSLEIAYAAALREGDATLAAKLGSLLQRNVVEAGYDRSRSEGHASGAESYYDPLGVLWFAPEVVESAASHEALPATDVLPFAGVVLQRNLSPDGEPRHGLMAAISGGSYVHSHASGMALELYGVGHVLGANAGKGRYTTDEHENYRRLFAANNTVIVNGASRSGGGWVNVGINRVEPVAMEPAVGAAPVSPNHSFTITRFRDDRGDAAEAEQERIVGIVRTAPDHGFYVDVFRSRSALPDQFHDYLYHNIGDGAVVRSDGRAVPQHAEPDRFKPVAGAVWQRNRSYLWPGWHVFSDVKVSPATPSPMTIDFEAGRLEDGAVAMRLLTPAGVEREVATAFAPETKEAPAPYAQERTPVLVLRQQGDAWDRPFAVVLEPIDGSPDASRIESVETLWQDGRFAGLEVRVRHAGELQRHLVIIPPGAGEAPEWSDARLGLTVRGRYAVLKIKSDGELIDAYLGRDASLDVLGRTLPRDQMQNHMQ